MVTALVAMPTWEEFLVPVLQVLSDGRVRTRREMHAQVADRMSLSESQRAEKLQRSGQAMASNRVGWAMSALVRAEALNRPRRGAYVLTDAGRALLAEHPERLTEKHLREIPVYRDYVPAARPMTAEAEQVAALDPIEQIEQGIDRLNADIGSQLLKRLREQDPAFLERSVLDLLVAMGYGGKTGAARHIGGVGDGGVDGVIDQDKLGLQQIYVQAKRYAADRSVGREAIQAFVGALHGHNVTQGIFITTSKFSQGATDYARGIGTRVILIDGSKLAELMISYDVGVQAGKPYRVVEVDEDYFE